MISQTIVVFVASDSCCVPKMKYLVLLSAALLVLHVQARPDHRHPPLLSQREVLVELHSNDTESSEEVAVDHAAVSTRARPEHHHPPMISQHEMVMEVPPPNVTEVETNSSQEASMDATDSVEDDSIIVQAKASPICPPRQEDLVEIEKACLAEDKLKDPESTSPAPMTDKEDMDMMSHTMETTTSVAEDTTVAPTTEGAMVMNTTLKQGRRTRKRTCNYHLCILRRLDVLDSNDMPDKNLLMDWIANNITDTTQRETAEQKMAECVASLKDIFGEAMESTEDETKEEMKSDETSMNRKKKSCTSAKKVISCLSKSAECPILKI